MDAYEDLRSLGRGSYAVVRLVKRREDGELFVIKRFHTPLNELTAKERNEIAQEIRLLAHLRHPNIVQFVHSFVDNGTMHILMEFAKGGTLSKKISDREGELFPEEQIWEMFCQIVMALRYVASCNILHRCVLDQRGGKHAEQCWCIDMLQHMVWLLVDMRPHPCPASTRPPHAFAET
jgi:NIMA (never in mitosis gene a)-related kinase